MAVINTADKLYVGSSLVSKAYSGTNLVWPAATMDAATTAWINAVVAAGGSVSGSLTTGRQKLVNDFIKGLKTDGVWAKLDRLWMFAAENTQSALIDMVATSSSTAVNSPSFTSDRGYTGNASTSYINSNRLCNAGGNYARDSACSFGWNNLSQGTVDTGALFGTATGTTASRLIACLPIWGDNNSYSSINGDVSLWQHQFANSGTRQGLYVLNRTASTASTVDINGVQKSSNATASWALTGDSFLGLFGSFGYSPYQISALGLGGSLSSTERVSFYNRMRTYMTAVGVT